MTQIKIEKIVETRLIKNDTGVSFFLAVKFFVDVLELLVGDVGVNLGGGDGRMSKHGLHAADIGAISQKIGRKTMPQGMRMNILD